MSQTIKKKEKIDISKGINTLLPVPDLNNFSNISYEEILKKSLEKMVRDMFPIEDSSKSKFLIQFVSFKLEKPVDSEKESFRKMADYGMPLKVTVEMQNKFTEKTKRETLSFGLIPKMTPQGTFIRKGLERSAIGQNVQSFGILFQLNKRKKSNGAFFARILPERGIFISVSADSFNHIFVTTVATNRLSLIPFLMCFGFETKEKIIALFSPGTERDIISDMCDIYIEGRGKERYVEDVYKFLYRNMSSGMNSVEGMRKAIDAAISPERFDLGITGRKILNKKIQREMSKKDVENKRGLDWEDFVGIGKKIIKMNNDPKAHPDCTEHLENRRIKMPGELYLQNVARQMYRIRKSAIEVASSVDPSRKLDISPADIVYSRSLAIASKDFFDGHTQLVEQRNGISILETKRTFDASGPGGISRTQAPIEMRDVHYSQYGRICPVFTPENESVGLVTHPSIYARINEYGFLETPYYKVVKGVITDEIKYMTADDEEELKITHIGEIDGKKRLMGEEVEVRHRGEYLFVHPNDVDYIDVSKAQLFSSAFCLIPGSRHNQVVRNFYGTNMQKQALPCLNPEAPIVATGFEKIFAESQIVRSEIEGTVSTVDARGVTIASAKGKVFHSLETFKKGNEKSFMLWQRPVVSLGEKVEKGQVLAENHDTDNEQIAIGKNVRVAFLAPEGWTYEDSILISERLIHKDTFTSIQVQKHVVNVRDTRLEPEITTYDIPNVSESRIKNLDEEGIVRVGSIVKPGDYIVGKISPRGDIQQSPEERLLQSIFGEKAKDVKDSSEFLAPGTGGRVIDVQVFTRDDDSNLDPNVNKQIRIIIASKRSIQPGDKLSNRHGGKGIISKVLPVEDMPYTEDGEPIDILLSPIGVISRKNPAQLLENYLGEIARILGKQIVIPPISDIDEDTMKELLQKTGVSEDGKQVLYDGKTGDQFKQKVGVGVMYITKLDHMVEDKIHARSVGPHMLISQQPTPGRARKGGQRFGEMEGWAMTAHGAAYNMREMMTIKSDDLRGRFLAYQAIVNDRPITYTSVPASFNVLIAYLRALCMDIQFSESAESFESRDYKD